MMSRRLVPHLAPPQSLPRRPSVSGPCPAPSRFSPFARPPIFQLISSFPIFSSFHLHPYSTDEVSPPSPTPSNLRGPRVFRSCPQFHGCEGVSGKRRGASSAAGETAWARAEGPDMPDDGSSNPPCISPGKRPDKAPDPGAYFGAHFRADSRAISRPKKEVPQSIAGPSFSALQAWSSPTRCPRKLPRAASSRRTRSPGGAVGAPRETARTHAR